MSLRDLDILARTIVGEARGQTLEGQTAVAHVIYTRAKQSVDPVTKKGKSITDICLAPKQFSCWNKNDPNRPLIEKLTMDDRRYQRAYGIACLVLTGDLPDPTKGADHYYNPEVVEPYWAAKMKVTAVIGDHKFLTSRG